MLEKNEISNYWFYNLSENKLKIVSILNYSKQNKGNNKDQSTNKWKKETTKAIEKNW